MDELLAYLKNSITDEVFSKNEKKTFKSLISQQPLDQNQLNFLRSRMYELANEKVNANNYQFILEWIKAVNSSLIVPATETTDAFFSPGDACRNVIIRQIESATSQLHICVFTISDDSITNSLLTAHEKGVNIKVITDNDKSHDLGSDIEQIAKAGIAVKMDTSPNHMHHKFMVTDQRAVITGSYNWTLSVARYNHENILLTHEARVIKSFSHQFEQLWKVMEKFE
jgi:mitochondrial cardiolipin hydrolase